MRYVVVSNLDVVGSDDNGINCDDGDEYDDPDATRYVLFRDLGIRDIGGSGNQDCLKLSGVDDFWVLDSTFARCGGAESGSGIDQVGCHSGLVARNTFLTMSGSAVQCKGGSADIEIRANRMRDGAARAVNMGGATDFEFFRPPLSTTEENAEARDIRVIANVIEDATAPVAFVGCVDCLAANNTFVDPDNWLLRILQETTSDDTYTFAEVQNGRFVNNLVYYDRSRLSTTINVGPNTQGDTFIFANNLWYAHDDPENSLPADLPAEETDGIAGEDPELGGGTYTIAESSPAVGAGTDLEELTGDQAGNCFASPPSIGAFEVD